LRFARDGLNNEVLTQTNTLRELQSNSQREIYNSMANVIDFLREELQGARTKSKQFEDDPESKEYLEASKRVEKFEKAIVELQLLNSIEPDGDAEVVPVNSVTETTNSFQTLSLEPTSTANSFENLPVQSTENVFLYESFLQNKNIDEHLLRVPGTVKLKFPKGKAHLRGLAKKGKFTSRIIPSHLQARMCNTGNCNTLILGERAVGACPTCHSRRKKSSTQPTVPIAIEPLWKTFDIGEILSRTGAYKEADFISGIFYGSTKGGKTCATASFLKEVTRFQPERWSKESAFVFSSKPEETGWSNCMSASNVSKPVENDKGKLVLDQDRLRQIPKLKFPNRKFVCFDDVQSNISQGNDELSNYFTAGRHDDIDVLVLCQSMLKSRADIHSNVKFVFCFAGVQFSKVAEKYCFNHPKEAEKLLINIVNKKLYRCAVIDMWKRDYDSNSCADYIFAWIPENVSISRVSFPVTNDVVMEAPLETNEVVGVPKKKGGKKKTKNNTCPACTLYSYEVQNQVDHHIVVVVV